MSCNHTKHWGGGSDINVSRNVLRETFFYWCSVQRRLRFIYNINTHTIADIMSWLINPYLLCKTCSRSLLSVAKRRPLKYCHRQFENLSQKLVKLWVHHYSSWIWYLWKDIYKQWRETYELIKPNIRCRHSWPITQCNYSTCVWKQIKVKQ